MPRGSWKHLWREWQYEICVITLKWKRKYLDKWRWYLTIPTPSFSIIITLTTTHTLSGYGTDITKNWPITKMLGHTNHAARTHNSTFFFFSIPNNKPHHHLTNNLHLSVFRRGAGVSSCPGTDQGWLGWSNKGHRKGSSRRGVVAGWWGRKVERPPPWSTKCVNHIRM